MIIDLKLGKTLLAQARYVVLEPHATTTVRRFALHLINDFKEVECIVGERGSLSVRVPDFYGRLQLLVRLCIWVEAFEGDKTNPTLMTLGGELENKYGNTYEQSLIDIFHSWALTDQDNFYSLSREGKSACISACRIYGWAARPFTAVREVFIDLNVVKGLADFLYEFSNALIGKRGYFGCDLRTFEDVLLDLYRDRNRVIDLTVFFLNGNPVAHEKFEDWRGLISALRKFDIRVQL